MPKKQLFHNGKHLSLDERIEIQSGINSQLSIRKIAYALRRSPSTILREIQKHTTYYKAFQNTCINHSCKKTKMCRDNQCNKQCKSCIKCIPFCEEYIPYQCPIKENHPLKLCNGCTKFNYCRLNKAKYEARTADRLYHNNLVEKRSGFDLTEQQIEHIDKSVTPLVKRGLSPYAIKQTLGTDIPISESTLRRLIDDQKLDARRIDLRDAVKRKPRKKRRTMKDEVVSPNKEGHLYSDYLDFMAKNPDTLTVQMDCVEGLQTDSKTLLTLHFPAFHFQLAFLMPEHTSKCVADVLDKLEKKLGKELYNLVFGVILTDNGHEFLNIQRLERSIYGGKRGMVFFCEPNRSDQKAECETNHKLIRYIIPKKTSFENLTQEKVDLMMNHINNYSRKSLMGRTPYQIVKSTFPPKFLTELNISYVSAKKVCLTPDLLK